MGNQAAVDPGGAASRRATLRAFEEQITLFKYLSPVECRVIYSLAGKHRHDDGEVILAQGAPGVGLHIVERGVVTVCMRSATGQDVEVDRIGQYGHFGELSILNAHPASASIVAAGPVDILLLTRNQFLNLLHRSEGLGIRVLRALCEELGQRLVKANRARVGADREPSC
jgi:CRP-like cAMP-binding protein